MIVVTLDGTTGGTAGFGGAGGGAGVSRGRDVGAADAGCPEGSCRTARCALRAETRSGDANDLAIAGLTPPRVGRTLRSVSSVDYAAGCRRILTVCILRHSAAGPRRSSPVSAKSPARGPAALFKTALADSKVPDFRGMTLRAVLEESAAAGVAVEVQGTGMARNQEPPAGSLLPQCSMCGSSSGDEFLVVGSVMTLGEVLEGVKLRGELTAGARSDDGGRAGIRFAPGGEGFRVFRVRGIARRRPPLRAGRGRPGCARGGERTSAPAGFRRARGSKSSMAASALAAAARNFYGRPDERVHFTGITGTNGKTTTVLPDRRAFCARRDTLPA